MIIQPTPSGDSSHGSFTSSFSYWIYIRLVFNVSQIVASGAVLVVSRNEKPQAPLPTWVVGYAAGCAACIPILFQHHFLPYPTLLECFEWMVIWYFFYLICCWRCMVIWGLPFFKGSKFAQAYIEFIMPFILCAVLACCWGNHGRSRGATSECINSLPTYNFELQKDGSGSVRKNGSEVKEGVEAAGTEKDRATSGDDAVCCICLASYADNDVLKELPCSHFFHTSCVDKWQRRKHSVRFVKTRFC